MRNLIAANLKMNKTLKESSTYIKQLKRLVKNIKKTEIVVCLPFTNLTAGNNLGNIGLGAQNVFYEENGAYTGEISALMLKACMSNTV